MKQFLLITLVGDTKRTNVTLITELIQEYECVIEQSHLTSIGNQWVLVGQITGPWNHIAKLENALPPFAKEQHLSLNSRRSAEGNFEQDMLPYTLEINALRQENLLHDFCVFFNSMEVVMREFHTETNHHLFSNHPFDVISMKLYLPADTQLSDFHEQFMALCDELNIDAALEPEK